jgi:truncated hemoglobin YjbI
MTSVKTGLPPDGNANSPLLKRVGGQAGLDALVGAFFFNALRDERVADRYAGVNLEVVMRQQRQLLAMACGKDGPGPSRQLRVAHRRLVEELGLGARHFDALIEILATTLDNLGHRGEPARSIVGRFAALKDDVLDRA